MKYKNIVAGILTVFCFVVTESQAQKTLEVQELENGNIKKKASKANYLKRGTLSKLSLDLQSVIDKNTEGVIVDNNAVLVRAFPNQSVIALEKDLASIGAKRCKIRGKYVTAWIPIDKITSLESLTSLKHCAAQTTSQNTNSFFSKEKRASAKTGKTVTQGDISMLTKAVRENLKVDGTGIRIGVMSNSYDLLESAAQSVIDGDLPGANNPNGYTQEVVLLREGPDFLLDSPAVDEGRAMAEIIHDIAPGAEIFIRTAFLGIEDYVDGIYELADAGVDFIVDDINYFDEPYFQDGVLNQAIDDITTRGITYFTAALNAGLNSYEADFVDSGIDIGGPWGRLHDFGNDHTEEIVVNNDTIAVPTLPFVLNPGQRPNLTMQWDDPSIFANPEGPGPDSDLTIMIIGERNGVRSPIAWSTHTSITNEVPFERVNNFTNLTEEPLNLSIAIGVVEGPNPGRIKFINQATNFGFRPFTGTLVGHANAAGAITVGAVNYNNTPQFGGTLQPWFNSSVGGTAVLLDRDGNPIAPIVRNKPDFMGPHGANTSFFGSTGDGDVENDGFPNFFGTSSAAPHAAAAAVLMQEVSRRDLGRDLTKDEILTAFINTAIDFRDSGFDFSTGHGFIQADVATASILPYPSIYRFQVRNATTNDVLGTLFKGDEIDLSSIEGGKINIEALANFGDSANGTVRFGMFSLGSGYRSAKDFTAPYIAFEDQENPFVTNGKYTLSATPKVNYTIGRLTFMRFSIINGEENRYSNYYNYRKDGSELESKIYPNPSTGVINIVENEKKIEQITVFNFLGQRIYENSIYDTGKIKKQIDLSSYTKGMYTVKTKYSNHKDSFEKIIIK
ncbi:T9SS type A sorting domain-containing protein [Aquimarina sp. 2201CG1-2-11]|uniref:T9SS type A sorting domain-containing protein n=1 Tax=Aquimarina discodermiae TaxID=3231043 RepID=UPI0034623C85